MYYRESNIERKREKERNKVTETEKMKPSWGGFIFSGFPYYAYVSSGDLNVQSCSHEQLLLEDHLI